MADAPGTPMGFDAWQQAMQNKLAPIQSQIAARNGYFDQYHNLLNSIAAASAPTYSPSGTFDPNLGSGGYALQPNATANVLGSFAQGGMKPSGSGYIDPGAFNFARSYLTGANKGAALPTGLPADLQAQLDAFRTQYANGAPGVYPVMGSGSRPLLARKMAAGMQGQMAAGQDSWNHHQQDVAANAATQNQAYTDMMGGQNYGGVIPPQPNPNAVTPWTPPQAPQGGGDSPWGFAGGSGDMRAPRQRMAAPAPSQAFLNATQHPPATPPPATPPPATPPPATPPPAPPTSAFDFSGVGGQPQNNADTFAWLRGQGERPAGYTSQPSWGSQYMQPGQYPSWDSGVGGTQQANGDTMSWLRGQGPQPANYNPMTFGSSPWGFGQ